MTSPRDEVDTRFPVIVGPSRRGGRHTEHYSPWCKKSATSRQKRPPRSGPDACQSAAAAGLQSVRNAARLLREFAGDRPELGVTEVARRLDISTSTAFRLLPTTLAEERLLERVDGAGRYRLGVAMYELGVTVFPHAGLHEAAVPVLANVRHVTGENVQLTILDHLEVVFVERLESPQTLRYVAGVGHQRLHVSRNPGSARSSNRRSTSGRRPWSPPLWRGSHGPEPPHRVRCSS